MTLRSFNCADLVPGEAEVQQRGLGVLAVLGARVGTGGSPSNWTGEVTT